MKLLNTMILLGSLALTACNSNATSPQNTTTVSTYTSPATQLAPKKAQELLATNAVLIDVRNPDEVAEEAYNVPNKLNIPLSELEARLAEVPKDKQVVVACQRGARSQKAFDKLAKLGYHNVANLEGGMEAWKGQGLPTLHP